MSSATDLITEHLREAQAIEQSSLSLLHGHLRGAPPGPYRTAARRHLDETRRHAHQVAERLTSLGASRGPVGTVVTLGEAIAGRLAGAALAPLHLLTGRTRPDVLLRNVQDEIAAEAREVATYEALERLAEAAGDPATASLARAIRDGEQRVLARLRKERREAERPVESEGPAAPAAEVHIEAPWDGYGTMKAGEIVERLRDANDTVRAMVRLYEQSTKNRKSILAATEP